MTVPRPIPTLTMCENMPGDVATNVQNPLAYLYMAYRETWVDLTRGGGALTPEVIVETVAKLQTYVCTCSTHCHIELSYFSIRLESQHHIDPRWQPTSTEYLDVLKAIEVKGKLLGVARERVFYLNTLRRHAGYILRIVHVMDTILLLFSH